MCQLSGLTVCSSNPAPALQLQSTAPGGPGRWVVKQMNHNINRRLALLVLASFTVFASAVVLRLGIGGTPYDATDSAGRPMGFNDRLHAEHYLIMLRNFSPTEFLKLEYFYEWVLFAAHILGAGILLSCGRECSRLRARAKTNPED